MNKDWMPFNQSGTELESSQLCGKKPAPYAQAEVPPSGGVGEEKVQSLCETARFLPFGPFRVRIRVQPGPRPRFTCRIRRKAGRPDASFDS
jgi:hypothetical protein